MRQRVELGRLERLAARAYDSYVKTLVGGLAVGSALLLRVLPGEARRRALVRRAARVALWASGTPLTVSGLDRLPGEPCVVVANHESWLDSLVLAAVLPARFVFVAGELFRRAGLAGFILRRIGAGFVDRSDPRQAVADVRRLTRRVMAGQSLVIFPEGGVMSGPELGRFHTGAFRVAVDSGRPVLPVTIRGTRAMLGAGGRRVARGRVAVLIGAPLSPLGSGRAAVADLLNRARASVLAGAPLT